MFGIELVNCTIENRLRDPNPTPSKKFFDSDSENVLKAPKISKKLRKIFFITIFEHLNSKKLDFEDSFRKSDLENFFELVHILHFVIFIHINFSLMWLRYWLRKQIFSWLRLRQISFSRLRLRRSRSRVSEWLLSSLNRILHAVSDLALKIVTNRIEYPRKEWQGVREGIYWEIRTNIILTFLSIYYEQEWLKD
jgi:hypothetical protein